MSLTLSNQEFNSVFHSHDQTADCSVRFFFSWAESDGSSPGNSWDEAAFEMEIRNKPRPALIQNGTRYLILKFKRTCDNSSRDTRYCFQSNCINALILTDLLLTFCRESTSCLSHVFMRSVPAVDLKGCVSLGGRGEEGGGGGEDI